MFKKIRSLVGRLFSENVQMIIVMYLSDFFWWMRKYFLSVVIDYPEEYEKNWKKIKLNSSQDKERNFTVYQIVKIYNEVQKNKDTNVIEFGVDRGGTISTICNFVKPNTNLYASTKFLPSNDGANSENVSSSLGSSFGNKFELIN